MNSDKRTIRAITKRLIANPFFPILFIGEFVKQLVTVAVLLMAINGSTAIAAALVVGYGVMALISVILWVLSDAIDLEEDVIGSE